jgi:hypothetical protein
MLSIWNLEAYVAAGAQVVISSIHVGPEEVNVITWAITGPRLQVVAAPQCCTGLLLHHDSTKQSSKALSRQFVFATRSVGPITRTFVSKKKRKRSKNLCMLFLIGRTCIKVARRLIKENICSDHPHCGLGNRHSFL